MKTKTTYRDGAIITTERVHGKYVATIRYTGSGDRETVKATFSTLLKAKVEQTIKKHYSDKIKELAKTAREINENAGKRKPMRNVLGAMDFTRI